MVGGLLAKLGNGISQQVSLYSSARGSHLQHFDSKSEEFLDEVDDCSWIAKNVSLCPRQIPFIKSHDFVAARHFLEDLGLLPADWEREIIFHCKSPLYLETL